MRVTRPIYTSNASALTRYIDQTTELTRLQVGDKSTSPVNLVVSTVLEAESIIPLLREYQRAGRKVNVCT